MYRFINFLILARVSLPFLRIYFSFQRVKQKKGSQHRCFQSISKNIPQLQRLTKAQTKRIQHYLFANSLTTQWFATLLQHKPTSTERMTGYYLATATPLADYLVDNEKLDVDEIKSMMQNNSSHQWAGLTQNIYRATIANHPQPALCQDLIFKTLQAQHESLAQKKNNLSAAGLKKVTWAKGGYALLLYRSALQKPISTAEWEAIFQLGGLMQLHNDIFDLHRDIQEGIHTIPTQIQSVQELVDLFRGEIEKTMSLFAKLPLSKYRKRKFYLLLTLAVNTGFICLDQYIQLEQKYRHFKPTLFSREELICDMEDPKKIFRTVWSTLNRKYL
ncbi:MAG: class 1 isoprenoid biosynthesis enzyme [Saprospiraceae bacterium]|nr:class 1 isoprenoid biosynthesis enzyme [Saprospiraceae bacterium]